MRSKDLKDRIPYLFLPLTQLVTEKDIEQLLTTMGFDVIFCRRSPLAKCHIETKCIKKMQPENV